MEIKCLQCGKFKGTTIFWAKFCSIKCKDIYNNERKRQAKLSKKGNVKRKPSKV